MADYLEALMLFFFSIGWYWSIARMLRSGTVSGKSVTFVALVTMGYGLGVAAQLARNLQGDGSTLLLCVYAWNLLVVGLDLALVVYFLHRSRARSGAVLRVSTVGAQPA
ncbi:MAG: hypothetical protein AAFV49_08025 [Pseudomonadota bacterium]